MANRRNSAQQFLAQSLKANLAATGNNPISPYGVMIPKVTGADNYARISKDLQYYQTKTMELQLELSKRRKNDPLSNTTLPLPSRERNPVLEQVHEKDVVDTVALKRNQAYYDKKVYDVRNRSLLFHSIIKWMDLTRILNADSDHKSLLSFLAFSKWKLKITYKVDFYYTVTSY